MRLTNNSHANVTVAGRVFYPPRTNCLQRLLCTHEQQFIQRYERTRYGPRRAGDSGRYAGVVCTRCGHVIGMEVML